MKWLAILLASCVPPSVEVRCACPETARAPWWTDSIPPEPLWSADGGFSSWTRHPY